jgi:hypothetical protein
MDNGYRLIMRGVPGYWGNSNNVRNKLKDLSGFCERLKALGICADMDIDANALMEAGRKSFEDWQALALSRRKDAWESGAMYVLAETSGSNVCFYKRGLKGMHSIPFDEFIEGALVELGSFGQECPFHARWPEDVADAEKRPNTPPVSEKFKDIAALFGISGQLGLSVEDCGPMPELLRDYYLELGAHRALNFTQDQLVKPEDLERYRQDGYLIFYTENQEVYWWAIREDDFGCGDPPVHLGAPVRREGRLEVEWEDAGISLSGFLHAQALMQAAFSLECSSEEFSFISEEDASLIRKRFLSKGAFPLWEGLEFFGNRDDCVIMVMKNGDRYNLLYSSKSEEGFAEMDEALNSLGQRWHA